jgi:hypothetical protein
VLLPGHFVHKANLFARGQVGAAIAVKHIGRVAGIKVRHGLVQERIKDFGLGGLIDRVPIHVFGSFTAWIEYNPAILGRPTGILAGIDGKRVAIFRMRHNTLIVGLFVLKELGVGQVAIERMDIGNAQLRRQTRFDTSIRTRHSPTHLIGIATRRIKRQ